jgi:hypothetical protein
MITLPTVNFPQPLRAIILKSLANPRATPDTALILADALTEYGDFLPPDSHFLPSIRQAAEALREYAPSLAQTPP